MDKILNRNIKIGVLTGGSKTEKGWAQKSARNIIKTLRSSGFKNVQLLKPDKKIFNILPKCDVVFISTFGKPWQSGMAQALCEFYSVPHTGSSIESSALAFNKHFTKIILKKYNIPTPKWHYSDGDIVKWENIVSKIGKNLILKPVDEGLGKNVLKVNNKKDYYKAFKRILKDHGRIVIERFIHGTEITVPVVRARDIIALPPIEIIKRGDIVNYVALARSKNKMYREFCVEKRVLNLVKNVASKCFIKLDCKGTGYVDMIFDKKNSIPYVLEVGTIPGYTDKSKVPFSASLKDISLSQLIEISLLIALNKNVEVKKYFKHAF